MNPLETKPKRLTWPANCSFKCFAVKSLTAVLLAVISIIGIDFYFAPKDDDYMMDEASEMEYNKFITAWCRQPYISLKSGKYINITVNSANDCLVLNELADLIPPIKPGKPRSPVNITLLDRNKFLIAIVKTTIEEGNAKFETEEIKIKSKKKDSKWRTKNWSSTGSYTL